MFRIDTSQRTDESEIMDDFELKGSELKKTLEDLDNINTWLGGNQVTVDGVKKLLSAKKDNNIIRIADIGCGNGAMLRKLSNWGRKNDFKFELIGIDANSYAIKIAEELSQDDPQINFLNLNIFSEEFKSMEFDIILCTLTLHHFKDNQIIALLNQLVQQSKIGVVINDLHRSKLAYVLFKAFCAVFVNNEIARKDGLVSILRGFKRKDLEIFKNKIAAKNHSIQWKWAFRYQWVIEKGQNNI